MSQQIPLLAVGPLREDERPPDDLIKDPFAAMEMASLILNAMPDPADDPRYATWIIPQSGGKDSRAVLWLILILLYEGRIKHPPKTLVIYMADTLMEFPSFIKQAVDSLASAEKFVTKRLNGEKGMDIQAHTFTTRPRPHDDFWVRILGRGYAPPSTGWAVLDDHQKTHIQAYWLARQKEPTIQAAAGHQPRLIQPEDRPWHISQVHPAVRTADWLARLNLKDDQYHQAIQAAAMAICQRYKGEGHQYWFVNAGRRTVHFRSHDNHTWLSWRFDNDMRPADGILTMDHA